MGGVRPPTPPEQRSTAQRVVGGETRGRHPRLAASVGQRQQGRVAPHNTRWGGAAKVEVAAGEWGGFRRGAVPVRASRCQRLPTS